MGGSDGGLLCVAICCLLFFPTLIDNGFVSQVSVLRRVKRDGVKQQQMLLDDPLYGKQWYLDPEAKKADGTTQYSHLNQYAVWKRNITGRGVVISVVDDGLEFTHGDLLDNYNPDASYDFNDFDFDPTPRFTDDNVNKHGTRCAGAASSVADNGVCGVGVAYGASIGGIRMLDGYVTDSLEASALSFKRDYIDIYSCSWGPDDDGHVVEGPGEQTHRILQEGVLEGRMGLGSIFVWASGNGGITDNCNCDGYLSSRHTIGIGSATQGGTFPVFAEQCSSVLAVTYSSASNDPQGVIVTTDLHGECTEGFTGTSVSAPLAAGVIALALEANPCLSHRDVQHLIVQTSSHDNLVIFDLNTNGAGYSSSSNFGFGVLDADALVRAAENLENSVAAEMIVSQTKVLNIKEPRAVDSYIMVSTGCNSQKESWGSLDGCIVALEHVEVHIRVHVPRRGELRIKLQSPDGTISQLLTPRPKDTFKGLFEWTLMSVHFWGENPAGEWKLYLESSEMAPFQLKSWSLRMYGTQDNDILKQGSLAHPKTIQRGANICQVCDRKNTYSDGSGNCRKCHSTCAYGCAGPGELSCLPNVLNQQKFVITPRGVMMTVAYFFLFCIILMRVIWVTGTRFVVSNNKHVVLEESSVRHTQQFLV